MFAHVKNTTADGTPHWGYSGVSVCKTKRRKKSVSFFSSDVFFVQSRILLLDYSVTSSLHCCIPLLGVVWHPLHPPSLPSYLLWGKFSRVSMIWCSRSHVRSVVSDVFHLPFCLCLGEKTSHIVNKKQGYRFFFLSHLGAPGLLWDCWRVHPWSMYQ